MEHLPNDFRYFLSYLNVRTELVFAPSGWDKNSIVKYKRDLEYFGIIRNLGLPLEFVKDGARILRTAYYGGSLEAGVKIEVEQLNRSTLKYELSFVGDIDFSKFNDDNDTVSVTLLEAGPGSNIKAYDSVTYEYPLTGSDVFTVILPGVAFNESATSVFDVLSGNGHSRFIPGSTLIVNEMLSSYAESKSADYQDVNDSSFSGSGNWFIQANRVLSVRVKGTMSGTFFNQFGPNQCDVYIMNNSNAIVRTLFSATGGALPTLFSFDFDTTINMISGQKLFFYFRHRFTAGTAVISGAEFDVSYSSVSDPSECKGIRSFDLFKRIIQKVSPGAQANSTLLTGKWKDLIFTSGDGIRAIPEAKIKISLKDFYATINAIEDAGMGIENGNVIIDLASYFSRNIACVKIGEVKECEFRVATEFMFNSVNIGYRDGNTDEINGREEYNSMQVWALPITRISKVKDWVSKTRADQYGIENLRVNVVKKATADNTSDNNPFMIDCYYDASVSSYRPILGSSYQLVEGLSSPNTSYNLNLTPKKNLLRHGSYLSSILHNLEGSYINFASAEKNANVRTVKDNVSVKENENILVSSLPDGYFLPTAAKITCKLPFRAMNLFDANPFGYVEFVYKNVTLKGFIMECSVDIAKNTEQEFDLLLTSDNNLLKLV